MRGADEVRPISTGSTELEIDCDGWGQRVRKNAGKNRPTAECTQESLCLSFFLSFFLSSFLSFFLSFFLPFAPLFRSHSFAFRILYPIVNGSCARYRARSLFPLSLLSSSRRSHPWQRELHLGTYANTGLFIGQRARILAAATSSRNERNGA